jgi:predicted N-acetyltransferase YhbS
MTELATATVIPLDQVDPDLVDRLLDEVFGAGRRQRTAYLIRSGTEWLPALSFAALDEDQYMVATIQAWPVALTDGDGRAYPLIMVGPVAVDPRRQNEGFGRALMAAQAAALDPSAPLPQVLIGDAPYYQRFGFTEAPRGWRCPGPWDPERLLVRGASASFLPASGMLGPWQPQHR